MTHRTDGVPVLPPREPLAGRPTLLSTIGKSRDGHEVIVSSVMAPVWNADGEVVAALTASRGPRVGDDPPHRRRACPPPPRAPRRPPHPLEHDRQEPRRARGDRLLGDGAGVERRWRGGRRAD